MTKKLYKKPSRFTRYIQRYKRNTPSLIVDTIDILHRLPNGIKISYPYTSNLNHYSPFFIVGCGRSGNTLLRKLLMERSNVVIPPEIPGLGGTIRRFTQIGSSDWPVIVQKILAKFLQLADVTIETWDNNNKIIRYNLFEELAIDFYKLEKQLIELSEDEKTLEVIISTIYKTYSINKYGKILPWGDKTPWNVFHYERIKKVYPNAKYIHMLRDGRACVSSYMDSLGKEKNISLTDAAYRWSDSVEKCFKIEKLEGSKFITVRYEHLVAEPEEEIKRVITFLGLEERGQNDRYNVNLGDSHLAHHLNLSKPVNSTSIDKWKMTLSEKDLCNIYKIIKKTLFKAGYH